MTKLMLSAATAVGLFLTPALAEQNKTGADASGDLQINSQAGEGAAAATATGAAGTDGSAKSDRMDSSTADAGSSTNAGSDTPASARMAAGEGDRVARDSATRSATQAGMKDVVVLDRAFVVEGINSAGNKIYMIVNPPGVLVGLGGPVETASADASAGGNAGAGSDLTGAAGADMTVTGSISKDGAGDQPQAGEPATATQAQSASPEMWDSEAIDRDMKRYGLDKATQ